MMPIEGDGRITLPKAHTTHRSVYHPLCHRLRRAIIVTHQRLRHRQCCVHQMACHLRCNLLFRVKLSQGCTKE